MCEKCGFSGCNHDWKKWQPNWYSRGYDDAINGRSANPPELMLGESGYMAGYEHAKRDWRKRNLTPRAADEACTCPSPVLVGANPLEYVCMWCGKPPRR